MTVDQFFNSIEGAASLKDSELVSLFVYYLTVKNNEHAATVTSVSDCFKACDLTPPSRIAPYLSEGLSSEPQKFIKANGGYKLQRHYRELLAKKITKDPLTSTLEISSGNLTLDESKLLQAMEGIVPSAGISYQQAIIDLRDDKRMSFRGPALELREVLREIVDHLAPDKDVVGSAGFLLEKDRLNPTMKQKVRYILRFRGVGKTKAATPEDSTVAIDVILGDLTRSVYNLGSLATHVASERKQVAQVKRYIDAVLHDILEID